MLGKIGKVRSISSLAGEVVLVNVVEKFEYKDGNKTDNKFKQIILGFTVINDKELLECVNVSVKIDHNEELEKKCMLLKNKNVKGNINVFVSKDYRKSYSIDTLEVLKVQ